MKSHITASFREAYERLPEFAREQARAAYRLFRENPNHPGLRFKPVAPPVYAARVGLHYRALGQLHGDTIIWFWIGTHAEYDRLLRSFHP